MAAALALVLWCVEIPAEPHVRLCGFQWVTGHPCPLCGLTRALFALAKGRVAQALEWNALSPVALAMLFSLFWEHPLRGRMWAAGIAAFAAYGIWRWF